MFTSESKKKDFPLSSEWFGVRVFCKKSQKTTHYSTVDLALNPFVIAYTYFPLVKFLDVSFLQFPLVKVLDIFIIPCKIKRDVGDNCVEVDGA